MNDQTGFHEDFRREEKIEGSSDRGFGLVFAAFFALLGGFAWWHANPRWWWWFALAAAMVAISLVYPRVLAPFNWAWMRLGLIMFKVISPLTLGFIFFVMMAPMSLLLRLLNKDTLRRKLDPQANSYWIPREPPGPDPASMKNQF